MHRPRILSLCSGYGGLDLAVEAATGGVTRWVSDPDRDASTVLAARFPDAPNLGDLTAVDWDGLGGTVDILTAGYPCQPFSSAGRRQGEKDDRHIWPDVLRAVRSLRPGRVVLENVRGHLSLGFGRVLGDLAESGYVGSWVCVRASDVGAPHRRERIFVVAADADCDRREGLEEQHGEPAGGLDGTQRHDPPRRRCAAADTAGEGRQERPGPPAADPGTGPVRCCEWGQYTPAVARWERALGRPAPVPLAGKQLNARFVEWMMGLPEGWVTDLVPNRRALKVLGNGVVPQQAAAALRLLHM